MGGNQASYIKYNSELANTKEKGFTSIYRNSTSLQKLIECPTEEVQTLKDVILRSAKIFGNNNALGRIKLTVEKDSEGKDVEKREIIPSTYGEVLAKAQKLGKVVMSRKFYYNQPLYGMKFIGVFAKNRIEWMYVDFACILFGLTNVPLYDTLGLENLSYVLDQTEMTTLFVSNQTILVLLKLKNIGKLANIICFDKLTPEIEEQIAAKKIELFYIDDIISEGQKCEIDHHEVLIKPTDCFTFSYTSGTTGPPKGAMLSHRNFVSSICNLQFNPEFKITDKEVHISYLPLPHVMERIVIYAVLYFGGFACFYSGNTLKLKDDCQVIRPTVFVSVPRIFSRIVEGVRGKFNAEGWFKRTLINYGLNTKISNMHNDGSCESKIYDPIIFSKVKESFGGRLRMMFSGSAPMDPKHVQFLKSIMCCPFVQAYGSTENSGLAFNPNLVDTTTGHVGAVSIGLEFRLSDIPEMHYTSEDKDEQGRHSPRGQICVRGPLVFLGYYKLDEATKEAISHDGWLSTGDVGQVLPDSNAMKIIDRKKNIFKLQQGEYVAAEKVESIYMKCNLISEIFLHGDSTQSFAIAIATPHPARLYEWAQSKGIQCTLENVHTNKNVRTELIKELNEYGKKDGLHSFENAKNIFLEKSAFVDLGFLTNTMKLQRFQARKYYKNVIEELYKEGELKVSDKK